MKSLKESWKSQTMHLIANLAIGGFMVEWYANTPKQSYIYSGWSITSSNIMNLANNFMALLIVYWYGASIPEFKCEMQRNRLNYWLYFARHYGKKINIRETYPIRNPFKVTL
jgi:hypothetical protein